MKYIYLVRHGEAELSAHSLDIDRPLTTLGNQEAMTLGAWMQHQAIVSEKLYFSPARRTRETALHLAQALGIAWQDCQSVQLLYNIGAYDLLQWLRTLDESLSSVLIVGHNPGLSDLMNGLLRGHSYGLSTATLGGIVSDTQSWSNLLSANHRCLWFKPASEI